ncbi:protocadherin Fat 4 [Patella vulgata]|uniref:protocadherin Fat 4 n=1 Tax=Patella vulgata TaxID=6465 RepID=UPI00217F4A69|nr:protocadherin Fat 4 [Patella vulgata]
MTILYRLGVFLILWNGVTHAGVITAGSSFQWGFKESVRVPEELCFQSCSGRVKLISVVPSYCSACFDVWEKGADQCLYYVPRTTKLDYSKAASYTIQIQCEDGAVNPEATVHLSVIPNFPPRFTAATNTITLDINPDLKANDVVYLIPHTDSETDVLSFEVTEQPNNGFFRVDSNGNLKAMKNLNTFCSAETLQVSMTDHHNPKVYLTIKLNTGTNSRLILKDWNKSITYQENKKLDLYIADRLPAPGNCSVRSEPTSIAHDLTLYCPAGIDRSSHILTNSLTFDFEKDPPMNITLTYDNGNCPSNTRWLYIYWSDVPEKPLLTLTTPEYNVNEGFIEVQPDYSITDEDLNEKHTYSFYGNANGAFSIAALTGKITTLGYLRATAKSTLYTFQVQVTDKSGLNSDPVRVFISVSDINDHKPVLAIFETLLQATECQGPAKFLTLTATDEDFDQNKKIEFIRVESGSMLINRNGEVFLTKPVIAGQFQELTVTARDKGEPPLESDKVTITLRGMPCPTTSTPPPPPTTQPPPPTTTPTTTPLPTTTESRAALNLPWCSLQTLFISTILIKFAMY